MKDQVAEVKNNGTKMEITEIKVTIRELVEMYEDNEENGVKGYGGKLDIRPPYQREFVYNDKQREAVIHSIKEGFPLNSMFWAVREDGTYEVMDGQQRTISICQYFEGVFSIKYSDKKGREFGNLLPDQAKRFLDYELMVYVCKGEPSDRLKWFETINIAGATLTKQEIRNAVYHGPMISDAKMHFSRSGNRAQQIGKNYLKGKAIRQEYLETAITWKNKGDVDGYMRKHQKDKDASALWTYFKKVIAWINKNFETVNREKILKGVNWGELYDKYEGKDFTDDRKKEIEEEIATLIADDEVQRPLGIIPYVLTRQQKHLSLRTFHDSVVLATFERQKGVCVKCEETFSLSEMQADHIKPWSKDGKTEPKNCQMLCQYCNGTKSNN